MFKPNPIAQAHQRLATLQRDYEAAHAHTVALESELLATRNEIRRLQPAATGTEAAEPHFTLGACTLCGRAVTFNNTKWAGDCRGCITSLHPRRHGELTAGSWELSVSSGMDECSYQENWYWTIHYRAPYEELPPKEKVQLRLQGEAGESLRLDGDTWFLTDRDRHATYRVIQWSGTTCEDVRAARVWATRAFVKSRPF